MNHPTPNKLLRVDLSDERVESERVPERWLWRYVGGKGLGARYLYDELEPGIDPLGPDNVLLFMLGPLSGYLPGEQRYAAMTKSPLTGGFLDSYSGGTFPGTLAGALSEHIGLYVTGRADEPVRIEIEGGTASLEPAADLLDADAVETDEAFPGAAIACVGPAGENRVAYATIATEGGEHHAGRGGAGAVMGAKGLKAVVARGELPDREGLGELREKYEKRIEHDDTGRWQAASETLETIDFANEVGALSTALCEPLDNGRGTEKAIDRSTFDATLDAYYARRGWSMDGRPTQTTLSRLGLDAVRDAETPVANAADVTQREENREYEQL